MNLVYWKFLPDKIGVSKERGKKKILANDKKYLTAKQNKTTLTDAI